MQSTWSVSTDTWTSTIHTWPNDTYTRSAVLAGDLGKTTAQTLVLPVTITIQQLLLNELHDEDRESSTLASLGGTVGMSSVANCVIPVSSLLSQSSGIISNEVWFLVGSISLDTVAGSTTSNNTIYLSSATLSNALAQSNTEELRMSVSGTLSSNLDSSTVVNLNIPVSIIQSLQAGQVHNVNYPESITLAGNISTSSIGNFLWNAEEEDTSVWVEQTEDSSLWTDIGEDTTTWTDEE